MAVRHLIVDRDGVLNEELPDGWVASRDQWRWLPGSLEAVVVAQRAGVVVSVATNQSGIGRGRITRAQVDALHAAVDADVVDAGGSALRWYVCPHAPDDGCACRKPAPGLVLEAAAASGVALADTVVVGDAERDLAAAAAARITSVLVLTGKGGATWDERAGAGDGIGPSHFADLAAAVARLVERVD